MLDTRTRLLAELRVRAGELGLIRFATADGDWVKSTGPRGGTIWTHSGSGAKRYQKNKPGGGGKKAAAPAKAPAAKPSGKAPAKAPAPSPDGPGHAPILSALRSGHGVAGAAELRAASGLKGPAFDAAMMRLADEGKVQLFVDADPGRLASLPPEQVIRDPATGQLFSSAGVTEKGRSAAPVSAAARPAGKPGAGLRAMRPPAKPKAPHPYEAALKSLLPDATPDVLSDPAKLAAALKAAHGGAAKPKRKAVSRKPAAKKK